MNALPTRTETGYQLGNLVAEKLPPRQAQTLLFCAVGYTEKKCAIVMGCSLSNVQKVKQTLFYKLGAHSSTEAITRAFANAYLRFLSFFIAVFISISAPAFNDHNSMARLNRTRPGNQLRARTSMRIRNDSGLFWVAETNELVWG